METRRAVAAGCVVGAAVTWASAWVLRRQHRLVLALEAAQEALAEHAAAEERARIAREVHDVIAHSLTVTMLHVASARLAVQDRPAEAIEALAEAERLGRRSLADVRRAVGALGDGDGSPPPSIVELPALVQEYEAAGVDVALTVAGAGDRLSAAASMALFRIAEESLANAARHAPGAHVDVELRIEASHASLTISNGIGRATPSVGERPGLGLTGMRQRAELIGAQLTAGRQGDGWRVFVDLPFEDGEA